MRSKITACPKPLQVEKVGTVDQPRYAHGGGGGKQRVHVRHGMAVRRADGQRQQAAAQQDDGQKAQQRGLRAVQARYFMLPHA